MQQLTEAMFHAIAEKLAARDRLLLVQQLIEQTFGVGLGPIWVTFVGSVSSESSEWDNSDWLRLNRWYVRDIATKAQLVPDFTLSFWQNQVWLKRLDQEQYQHMLASLPFSRQHPTIPEEDRDLLGYPGETSYPYLVMQSLDDLFFRSTLQVGYGERLAYTLGTPEAIQTLAYQLPPLFLEVEP